MYVSINIVYGIFEIPKFRIAPVSVKSLPDVRVFMNFYRLKISVLGTITSLALTPENSSAFWKIVSQNPPHPSLSTASICLGNIISHSIF